MYSHAFIQPVARMQAHAESCMHLGVQGARTAGAGGSHRDADRVEQLMANIFAVENPLPGSAQGGFSRRWHAAPRSPPNPEPQMQGLQLFLPPQAGAPASGAPHDLTLGNPMHAWGSDLHHAGAGAWGMPLACSGGSGGSAGLLHPGNPAAALARAGGSGGSLGLLERLLSMPSLPWDELLTPRAGGPHAREFGHPPAGALLGRTHMDLNWTGAFASGSPGVGLESPDALALPSGSGAAAGGFVPDSVVYAGKPVARAVA